MKRHTLQLSETLRRAAPHFSDRNSKWSDRLADLCLSDDVSTRWVGTRRTPGRSRAASPWRRFGKSRRLAKKRYAENFFL